MEGGVGQLVLVVLDGDGVVAPVAPEPEAVAAVVDVVAADLDVAAVLERVPAGVELLLVGDHDAVGAVGRVALAVAGEVAADVVVATLAVDDVVEVDVGREVVADVGVLDPAVGAAHEKHALAVVLEDVRVLDADVAGLEDRDRAGPGGRGAPVAVDAAVVGDVRVQDPQAVRLGAGAVLKVVLLAAAAHDAGVGAVADVDVADRDVVRRAVVAADDLDAVGLAVADLKAVVVAVVLAVDPDVVAADLQRVAVVVAAVDDDLRLAVVGAAGDLDVDPVAVVAAPGQLLGAVVVVGARLDEHAVAGAALVERGRQAEHGVAPVRARLPVASAGLPASDVDGLGRGQRDAEGQHEREARQQRPAEGTGK